MSNIQKQALTLFKFVGLGLFIWILVQLDRSAIIDNVREADTLFLILSFPLLFCIYFIKSQRWHALARGAGATHSVHESWMVQNIGHFLSTVTPARLGELGKAAYLVRAGATKKGALAVLIADRAADAIIIGTLALFSIGTFFGDEAAITIEIAAMAAFVIGGYALFLIRKHIPLPQKPVLLLFKVTVITLIGWCLYFAWAITLAHAVGITVEIPVLIAAFTLTGIIALLPIAPSGLGTRDAALIYLLSAYNVKPEQAVSLAFLMFISIIFSGFLGGIYWVKGVR